MTLTKQKADVCALCKQPIDWSWKNGEPDISIQMSKTRIGKFAHSSCVKLSEADQGNPSRELRRLHRDVGMDVLKAKAKKFAKT